MKKNEKFSKFLRRITIIQKLKVVSKKKNLILISLFVILLLSSTNSYNPYLSKFYNSWSSELAVLNVPEIQMKITGKLNESFVDNEISEIVNTTFDSTPNLKTLHSLTYLSRNYFNLSHTLSDLPNSTVEDFSLFVVNEQLLNNISISLKPEEAIVSQALHDSLENNTEVWFTAFNGSLEYFNVTIVSSINSTLLVSTYFLDLGLSFGANEKWIIVSYSGFYSILSNIHPSQWISDQNEDCLYTSVYSLDLSLLEFIDQRPKRSLVLFNNKITLLVNSIFSHFNNLDEESEFVFSTIDVFLRFDLIDSFNKRVDNILISIRPYLYSTILQFILLQAIILSIVIPLVRTYMEQNRSFISLSRSRGLKSKEIKYAYILSISSIYLISFVLSSTIQVVYYRFKEFFRWDELHLLLVYLLFYYILILFFIVYRTNSIFNEIINKFEIIKKPKKYSRSEKILVILKKSSFLVFPLVVLAFLFFNFRILNQTSLSIGYIFSLILCFVIFAYGMMKLPQNALRFSYKAAFLPLKSLSTLFIYFRKAKMYTLKSKKHLSTLLFSLLFILNISLIIHDSNSSHQSKMAQSSFGFDAMLQIRSNDLAIVSNKVNTSNQIIIYEIPGNELISRFYLVDNPLTFYEGCKFYNKYFSYYSNEQIFLNMEEDSKYIISSSRTQNTLNIETGDLFFPFIKGLSQSTNFTFLDFANFIPIIESISGEQSWILGNYNSNPMIPLIENNTCVYYSFKLTENLLLEELEDFLSAEGILFSLTSNEMNPYFSSSEDFEDFKRTQLGFIIGLNVILSVLLISNLLVSNSKTDQSYISYFTSHGLKPTKSTIINIFSNTVSFLIFSVINFAFCTGLLYIVALFLMSQNTVFYNLYLSAYSILLILLPFFLYLVIQISSIFFYGKINTSQVRVKAYEY